MTEFSASPEQLIIDAVDPLGEGEVAYLPLGVAIVVLGAFKKAGLKLIRIDD